LRFISGIMIGIAVVLASVLIIVCTMSVSAEAPGKIETRVMTRIKYWRIGGKDLQNPQPDTQELTSEGAEHFQHHCQICHGLDGQGTGVPLVNKMSPPVANLASPRVQAYSDGQLKWIIENGIRSTGMPGWKGILEDQEMWRIVRYLRHLPAQGSLGAPSVYKEEEEQHEHMRGDEDKEDQKQNKKTGEQKKEHR
jgi:mono/diheme cytochrome c family protein